jgi:hypothetical protein
MKMLTLLVLTLSFLLVPFPALQAFCFDEAGREYGVNPLLLESIARVESNLNPRALNRNRNGSVDVGLMQVNSLWIKDFRLSLDAMIDDPCLNTMIGARILRQCIDRHGYTWEAVGCYNALGREKRIDYSWKVFNALCRASVSLASPVADSHSITKEVYSEASTPAGTRKSTNPNQGSLAPPSFLFFTVRDADPVFGEVSP